jgi:eukaryotic-like serine/threonine-protein kinase
MPDEDKTLSEGPVQAPFRSIGPYRLIHLIGTGGMGEVWRAEQTDPFRRIVALKLIKAGMDTKTVVGRFESERQALALMEHPHIAKVFDAGATPEGRPYFVMEYVAGAPITDYCDRHRLTISERLSLFMQVCDGVQHAHQKAIIHRDLKPSNVLVEEIDGKPLAKIIDFGLAKATGQQLTDATMFTEVGAMVGTPAYMSPEQADRGEGSVDTRTDVYSLGVIFYELLVGVLPFSSQEVGELGRQAMWQKIRETEPTKPSTRIKSLGASSQECAVKRREEPQTLFRHLRGELDWIALKALEKERARRYSSPSEFAADVQRYLQNRPVLAGPPTAIYRAGKFVRRHRFGVGVAAIAVVLLIAFGVSMLQQARRIAAERDRANRAAESSRRVADFMTDMFKISNPSESRGNSITAREILDNASQQISSGLAGEPLVQARLMGAMGNVFQSLGLYPKSQDLLQRAIDIEKRSSGTTDPQTLSFMNSLGSTLLMEGHPTDAEKLQRQALEAQRRLLGPENRDTLQTMSSLAVTLRTEGQYPEAEKLLRQTVDARTRTLGVDNADTLSSMNALASVLIYEGQYAEAEKTLRQSLDGEIKTAGNDSPDTARILSNLGWVVGRQHRYAESEQFRRQSLDIRRRILGPEHPDTLSSINNLANTLFWEGRYPEAEHLYRETLTIRVKLLGPAHPDTLSSMNNLATALNEEHRYPEAERLYRQTIEIKTRTLAADHPDTLTSWANLANTLRQEGRYAEAEKMQRTNLEVQQRVLGANHPDTLDQMSDLANTLSHEGRFTEAETLYRAKIGAAEKLPGSAAAYAWYAFAAGAVIASRKADALQYLKKAAELGYDDGDALARDDDFQSLRDDVKFQAILTGIRSKS